MHLASSCCRNTGLCCLDTCCVPLRALLRGPCDLAALRLCREEVRIGVVEHPLCRPQSPSLGEPAGWAWLPVRRAKGETRSLLWLPLLWPGSSSFTSLTLSDVGKGRAVMVTAGMKLPVLDLPAGGALGRILAPRRRGPGSSCGRAADQFPASHVAQRPQKRGFAFY